MGLMPRSLRLIFSFPVFLAVALTALVALSVKDRFGDPDLWWHLRMGQVIWQTHAVPTTEIFSHTAAGHWWIPHEWLAQLSIFWAYDVGGYQGLMLWLMVSASSLLILLYSYCWLYSGNGKVAFLGGLIGWCFATVGLAVRPLVLGHALLVIELLLLHLGRTRDSRWFWGLPLLFALWVNCHGSYSFGLLILLVTAACGFINYRLGPIVSSAWAPATRKTLIWAGSASVAALFLNPMGWRLLTYPLNVLFQQHVGLSSVNEWQPLPFSDGRAITLVLILAGATVAAASRAIEIRLEELVLVSAAALLAVQHQRMLFLFGIMVAPFVCRVLANTVEGYHPHRDLPVANAVSIGIGLLVMAFTFPSPAELDRQARMSSPVAAVEFIRHAHLKGPMLNDYGMGGYLIWALPEEKVFVDGRGDVYDWTGVLEAFQRWALLEEDPQLLLNRYHIGFCILASGSPMSRVIPYLPGWRKAYTDSRASVFVRQSPGS
jgi:hypothetical protein